MTKARTPKKKPLTQTDLKYLEWQEEQRIAALPDTKQSSKKKPV